MDRLQMTAGALVLAGVLALAWIWSGSADPDWERLSLTALVGLALGLIFERSRFCMFCFYRDAFRYRNMEPLLGLLLALGVGTLGYLVVFGSWVPDPHQGYLPPNAFLTPVGIHLVVGGLLFGMGMALSGSCFSGHLYRLGSGSGAAVVALLTAPVGLLLGYLTWDFWYSFSIRDAPVIWLPQYLGYGGSAAVQLGLLAALAVLLWKLHRPMATRFLSCRRPLDRTLIAWLRGRWSLWASAATVGVLAFIAYLRLRPLGVTSELSRLSRSLGVATGLLSESPIRGLDRLSGCVPLETSLLLSENGVLVLTLIAGSLAACLLAGRFSWEWPSAKQVLPLVGGGILMGYGAMISLGCNIGNLLSGTMALSLSGWVFGAAMSVGLLGVLWITRKQPLSTGCRVPAVPIHKAPPPLPVVVRQTPPGFLAADELWRKLCTPSAEVLVLETGRSRDGFEAGHIPAAAWADFGLVYVEGKKGWSGAFPDSLDHLAPAPGVEERLIVVYDTLGGFRAARLALGLALAGWRNVLVLDNSLQTWLSLGLPLERGWGNGVWKPTGGATHRPREGLGLVDRTSLLARLGTVRVLDNRPKGEYEGKVKKAKYSGRIPGAVPLEWNALLEGHQMLVKQEPQLRQTLEQPLGTAQEVVCYCHTGERSSLVAWAIHHLWPDRRVELYDGSWEEWGNAEDLPREAVS